MATVPFLWNPGQNAANASPTDYDLLNPVWSQEVLTRYHNMLFMARTVRSEQIESGIHKDFQVSGRVSVWRQEKGDSIYGGDRKQITKRITLDDRPWMTAIEEEGLFRRLEQVTTRNDKLTEMAYALAGHKEIEVMKAVALAAQYTHSGSEPSEFPEGGNSYITGSANVIGTATNATVAYAVLAAIEETVKVWDELGVPANDRYCILPTRLWYEVRKLEKTASGNTGIPGGLFNNLDIVGQQIGYNRYMGFEAPLEYFGVSIYRSNFLTSTDIEGTSAFTADHSSDADRAGDFSTTRGLIWQRDCVGFVEKIGLEMKAFMPDRTFDNEVVAARTWTGSGPLRPEAAVELLAS